MRTHRLILTALAIATVLVSGLTVTSAPALATKTRLPLSFSPFGSFENPEGIAIDQASGNIYVADIDKNSVQVFGREGGPPAGGAPSSISGVATPQGGFDFNALGTLVAVDSACYSKKISEPACASADPSNGDVYLKDSARQEGARAVVDKFRLNGADEFEYICQFIGYTPAGEDECVKDTSGKEVEFEHVRAATVDDEGDVYIVANGNVYEFGPTGVPVATITSGLVPKPNTVAVDTVGNIYIADQSTGLLVELKRASFTAGVVESEVELTSGVARISLDKATGRLLGIGERSPSVSEYSQNGELQLQISSAQPEVRAIAVNEACDCVYVSGQQTIEVFGPPVSPVLVRTEGASGVMSESAMVDGSLNPQGQEAGARFEYGTSPSLGSGAALSAVASPSRASGESYVSVTGALANLEPNRTYYYQLVGTDSESSFYGEVESFATPAVRPTASVRSALFVGPHEAVLVGAANPENSDTHYRFVFGASTAYGTSVPGGEGDVGSNFAEDPVTSSVVGLQPGTTYHYAVVASNGQGTTQSGDMSFTTPAAPVPVVVTGAAEGVTQNSATIAGSVDPEGVSTGYEFDLGTDTSYGARVFGVAGSGGEPLALSLSVGGLQPDTTYHYRLVASNVYGTVYGADMTFTTPGFPSSLIAAPLAAPLVPVPAFSAPSTVGAVTVGAPKQKTKPKAKKKVRKKRRSGKRGRKASSAAVGRGERGRGEGGSGR
jgi:hypothetical protein